MDRLAELNVLAYNVEYCAYLVLALLDESVNTLLEILQSLSHSSVQHDHSRSTVGFRAYSTEFEAVAGECERRCTVAVGIVDEQFRNLRNVELQSLLAGDVEEFVLF